MARVYRRGTKWWIDFRDAAGRRRRKMVGPSKRVAREVLDGLLGSVARRQYLGVIDDSPVAFADFADEWWRRISHTLKPRTQERWSGILKKHLKPFFKGALRSVSCAEVEAYVSARRKPRKCDDCADDATAKSVEVCVRCDGTGEIAGAQPATVNCEVTVLKHIFGRAVEWEFRNENPLKGFKSLKDYSERTRFLSREEIDALLRACDTVPLLRAFAVVALNTGMRRNEILGLRRGSINWAERMVTIGETKNGEPRHIYLNEAAIAAIRSMPSRIDGILFPFTPNQVSQAFGRAVRRAQIANFRLHDLRHTFASYQAMAGTAGRGLQALLGRKDARMTMRYSHLADSYLKAAVDNVVLGGNDHSEAANTGAK